MLKDGHADVLIIGGGAAGLAAAQMLVRAGLKITILEARDRAGGRIFTHHGTSGAVELGAEFVHGRPPETFDLLQAAGAEVLEAKGDRWCSRKGELSICPNLYDRFEQVFQRMKAEGPDRSFLQFLEHDAADLPEDIRLLTLEYIEGFEAARPNRISEHSLVREQKASEQSGGDQAFRVLSGYDTVVKAMMAEFGQHCELHLNSPVRGVKWNQGAVEIDAEGGPFRARQAVVTLPLSLLQSEAVEFVPELRCKREALSRLEMGAVIRLSLRFRERFWDNIHADGKTLAGMSFLHSDHPIFPTWWTTMPRKSLTLTGWSAGPHGLQLSGNSDHEVIGSAIESLATLLHLPARTLEELLEESYFHNWQKDPFSMGAYSYACVGGIDAAFELAKPLDQTLFFAGEATEFNGHQGTVAGAIKSGYRAAREILETRTH